jgi:glycine cleavage system transcriptional repressor
MAQRWIVTALGKDRPGIVAGVTKVLYQLGGNLEDSAMTRLGGEFAIMLIFSAAGQDEAKLERAFAQLAKQLQLAVHVKPLTGREVAAPPSKGERYQITVYGGDKPGIVYRVSEALAKAKINILDVHSHRSARGGPSLYLLLLEVELPSGRPLSAIDRQLKQIAKRLGVQVSITPAEADVL